MQLLKLYLSKDVVEKENQQYMFNLQQFDRKNQNSSFCRINRNYEPLRLVEQNNIDQGYDNGFAIDIEDIRNNDKKILSFLKEDLWATYSFKSLERKLGIHQQSLSRALKRLVDLNLIAKTPFGYKLNIKDVCLSTSILQDNQAEEDEYLLSKTKKSKKSKKRFNQLIQICIPIKSDIDVIVNHLVGRWFGDLRWHGLVKRETSFILQWDVINKYDENNTLFQINLNIVSEYIVIESNATSDQEKIKAISNANRIITEIIKTMRHTIQKEIILYDNNLIESSKKYPKEIQNIAKQVDEYKT